MSKDSPPVADPRIALLGNMDEASASLGLARSEGGMEKSKNSTWNYSGFPTALWATWRCPRSRTRSGSNRSVSNKQKEWTRCSKIGRLARRSRRNSWCRGKAKLGVRLGFARSVVRKAERSMVAASLAQDHLHTRSPQPPLGRTVRRSPKRRGQARTIQGIEELQAKNHAHTIGAGRVGYRVKPRSAGGRGGHRGTAMRG